MEELSRPLGPSKGHWLVLIISHCAFLAGGGGAAGSATLAEVNPSAVRYLGSSGPCVCSIHFSMALRISSTRLRCTGPEMRLWFRAMQNAAAEQKPIADRVEMLVYRTSAAHAFSIVEGLSMGPGVEDTENTMAPEGVRQAARAPTR